MPDNIFSHLIMMYGRIQLRHWDPNISWNNRFLKVVGTFGSLQRRKWDPYILLSYLSWVESFVEKEVVIRGVIIIKVVKQKHDGPLVFILELVIPNLDRQQHILGIEVNGWIHRWLDLIYCLRTSNFERGGL